MSIALTTDERQRGALANVEGRQVVFRLFAAGGKAAPILHGSIQAQHVRPESQWKRLGRLTVNDALILNAMSDSALIVRVRLIDG
ncbi:MAG: hypothetical protein WD768_07750 [Phycisphaeraceae bacterium]